MNRKLTLTALLLAFFLPFSGVAQRVPSTKYPSLLWEITGNGLKKPSYLVGTMHVSSKLAFHLSDSFYYAIRKVDAVALELNPELWQGQMVDMNKLNEAYTGYVMPSGSEYVNE